MQPSTHVPLLPLLLAAALAAPAGAQADWGDYTTDLEISNPSPGNFDRFGAGVGIWGDLAVIGVPGDDDKGIDAGAVQVFDKSLGWAEVLKLHPTDVVAGDEFGYTCAVDLLLIAAASKQSSFTHSGAVYLFDAILGQQIKRILAPQIDATEFGRSLDTDNNITIVGARRSMLGAAVVPDVGVAYLFDGAGFPLNTFQPSDGAASDFFGTSVAIHGNRCIVGSPKADLPPNFFDVGAAYVFDVTTGAQLYKLLASDGSFFDEFGTDVAIHGDFALVGAPKNNVFAMDDGAAYLFDLTTGIEVAMFTSENTLPAGGRLGQRVALDADYGFLAAPGIQGVIGADPFRGRIFQVDLTHLNILAWFTHPDPTAGGASPLGGALDVYDGVVLNGDETSPGPPVVVAEGAAQIMTKKELGLGIDKPVATTGETLTFTLRGGQVGGLAGFAAIAINGNPLGPIVFGLNTFDASGELVVPVPVPPGLGGNTLTFWAAGIAKTGALVFANTRDVQFL